MPFGKIQAVVLALHSWAPLLENRRELLRLLLYRRIQQRPGPDFDILLLRYWWNFHRLVISGTDEVKLPLLRNVPGSERRRHRELAWSSHADSCVTASTHDCVYGFHSVIFHRLFKTYFRRTYGHREPRLLFSIDDVTYCGEGHLS